MVANCFVRGHKAHYDINLQKWAFDDDELNEDKIQICPRCKQSHSPNDCDYCLRDLQQTDFIVSACCGHSKERGYIKLADGRVFREELDE